MEESKLQNLPVLMKMDVLHTLTTNYHLITHNLHICNIFCTFAQKYNIIIILNNQ